MSNECVAKIDWPIIQGASFDKLVIWSNPRSIFTVIAAGLSDATPPVWPPEVDDTVVDNTVTWENTRLATLDDINGVSGILEWQASTTYGTGETVLSTRQPVDLTGYTGRMQIRDDFADEDGVVLFEITTVIDVDGNGIYLGTTDGEVRMVIQPGTTDAFDWDPAGYDLELISPIIPVFAPEGFVKRLMQGTMKVSKERTRDTATVTTP